MNDATKRERTSDEFVEVDEAELTIGAALFVGHHEIVPHQLDALRLTYIVTNKIRTVLSIRSSVRTLVSASTSEPTDGDLKRSIVRCVPYYDQGPRSEIGRK
jgi:hypothetical protein